MKPVIIYWIQLLEVFTLLYYILLKYFILLYYYIIIFYNIIKVMIPVVGFKT
jgi:hypothetical protein